MESSGCVYCGDVLDWPQPSGHTYSRLVCKAGTSLPCDPTLWKNQRVEEDGGGSDRVYIPDDERFRDPVDSAQHLWVTHQSDKSLQYLLPQSDTASLPAPLPSTAPCIGILINPQYTACSKLHNLSSTARSGHAEGVICRLHPIPLPPTFSWVIIDKIFN